jgi:hypothetical protein
MRLIFKGRIIDDNQTLSGCGIDGHGLVVVHGAPISQTSAALPVPQVRIPGPTTEPLPVVVTNPGRPDPPGFAAKVRNLSALGFSQGDCEIALRAAMGNVDRAADYLLSGHTPKVPQFVTSADLPARPDDDSDPDEDDDIVFPEDEDEDEESVRLRTFTRFRNQLIRDPASLRHFLNEMAEANPAVARLIRDDPGAFLAGLGLNPEDFDLSQLGRKSQYEQLMAGFDDNEKAAIHELEALGFDSMTVLQVFVACGKQKDLAEDCLRSM